MIAIPRQPEPGGQPTEREAFVRAWRRFRAALRRLWLLAMAWLLSKLLGLMVRIQKPLVYRLIGCWEELHGANVAHERLIGSLEDAVHSGNESGVPNG